MRYKGSVFLGLAALVCMLAGCGGSSSTAANPTATTAPTATPTATATVAPTATTAAASDLPIKTFTSGSQTWLATAQGVTLYYRKSDSGTSVYSGPAWPALLSPNGTPTSSVSLPGKLGVLQDANGTQVTYNGHPLYTYAGDGNVPGQATGNGIGGVWFIAMPSLT